ncbi:VWA domain-containing protein [Thiorhodovibrio frisius]|uniref:Tetratricopeptide repeat protein,von Willebrand factor type A-like protein n=1 Tax=Thiorhodovibrio frisius TaxID=631362 RepID=H8Z6I8_9GAMM|nr:VWA domain-containing protein [Thiorhodovibrio frisius]EIC19686.1 tetratricopeptide repeat protein,von Willebrand factor type A-like protein [Thiorhodovibrio frisius]WPL20346.1 Deacetylase [Thiorhodovibrio frisius]
MLSDFHFLHPWWLLALLPLVPILWLGATNQGNASSAWRRVIDARLLPVLTLQPAKIDPLAARLPLMLLALGWLVAVLALANPTFERKPVPTYSGGRDRVVVLDLSRSMEAADLTPSRLARARYKVADILARVRDGRVGLIAFAGDAFTVAPLTQDSDTILAMLEALQPDIMPVPGSRPDLALERADALLEQAGATSGEVVLITDDAGDERARAATEALKAQGHRLAVIGVGTAEGAPVPGVRRADGPVITSLDADALRALARAGGGAYAKLTSDDRDLDAVLSTATAGRNLPAELTDSQIQAWYPLGPWIALALLPLAALAFRRGWLLVTLPLLIGPMLIVAPAPAQALGWNDLWQRRDQQAAQALAQGEAKRARELAPDPQLRATAAYRAGDYQAAAQDFAAGETATDHYNRGNALARAGALEDALTAYEEALALEEGHEDARYNRDQVKELLEQQQEQEQEQEQQEQQQDQDSKSGEDSSDQNQDGQSGEESGEKPSDQDQEQEQDQSQNQSEQSQDNESQDGDSSDDGSAQNAQSEPSSSDSPSPEKGEQESQSPQDSQASEQEQPQPSSDGGQTDNNNQQASEDQIEPGRDQQAEQQAAEDYREAAEAAQAAEAEAEDEQDSQQAAAASQADEGTPEEQEARAAAEQWLRRIPDDPAGLLRRKFLYQYSQRAGPEQSVAAGKPW